MTQEPSVSFNPAEAETWETLARYLAGESPDREAETVRAWLAADPAREAWLSALDHSLDRVRRGPQAHLDIETPLRKVKARIGDPDTQSIAAGRARRERRRPAWRTNAFRIAASVVLLLGAALVWRSSVDRSARTLTWSTSVGQADSVRLPDGSFVLLGPASQLTLAGGFGGRSRELELVGEGFFNVVHDEDRPFTVNAGGASILDLGTAFTVRTDHGETVQVVVTEGAVRLKAVPAPAGESVTLSAGDRGLLGPDGRAVAQRAAATDADLAWTLGRLVFDNAPMDRVAADLRRWYGVRFEISDPALADRRLTATFEGETIDQVLDVIGLTLGARVERAGDTAFLRSSAGAR